MSDTEEDERSAFEGATVVDQTQDPADVGMGMMVATPSVPKSPRWDEDNFTVSGQRSQEEEAWSLAPA